MVGCVFLGFCGIWWSEDGKVELALNPAKVQIGSFELE
jgi:hypothetical protein